MSAIQYGQYKVPDAVDCVNFGVGQPAPGMLPLEKFRDASAAKLAEEDPLLLQYGFISGYTAFRETLASFLTEKYGKDVHPDNLFVTNGISGTLGLLCSLFTSRGDVVVVENPAYFLALSIFRDFGLKIVPVDLDAEGLRTDDLETLLKGGLRPKFLYTIPAFQNPTGANLSEARKRHLVKLAREYDFMVFADEVYQLLGFPDVTESDGPLPAPLSPPLCFFDTDGKKGDGKVVSLGSFSKILAPATRLGWFQTSPAANHLLEKVYNSGQLDSSGGLNPIMSGIVHKFMLKGYLHEQLAELQRELSGRARALGNALRKSLPAGAEFKQPAGGYFIWIKLPDGITGAQLLEHSIAHHKLRFHPGERFGSGLQQYIRLSFSYYKAEDLTIGAERLGDAIRSLLAKPAPVVAAAPSQNELHVCVHGATGRLGSLIVSSIAAGFTPQEKLKVIYDGSISRDTEAFPASTQVIVDVSLPEGTNALLRKLTALHSATGRAIPVVIGTTGDLPWSAIEAYAKLAPVQVCWNFSAGIPLVLSMLKATQNLLPHGWHTEVTEIHHTAKKDAPSGTAKRLVTALEDAGVKPFEGAGEHIPVHALRLGDTIGQHTVYLAGPGERVEVTHIATKREVFAFGAIRWAAWLVSQPKGLYKA